MPKKPYSLTRFGCKTCKQRKIRCDEKRPTCGNCAKAARDCQRTAYGPSSLGAVTTFTAPLTLFHFGPLQQRNIRHDEIVYLDTFRHKLVEDLAGKFGRLAWRSLILQTIHDEAALCHLAVAYGALNHILDVSQHHDSPRRTTMALVFQHYTKGINGMQRVLDGKEHDCRNVVLLCSLLCICFEIRCRRPRMTLFHLRHALQILSSGPLHVDDDITLAFTRLDILAAVSLRRHSPITDIERFSNISQEATDPHWKGEHDLTVFLGELCCFIRTEVDDVRFCSTYQTLPLHIKAAAQLLEDKLHHFRQLHLESTLPNTETSAQMPSRHRSLWLKFLAAVVLLRQCFSMEEKAFDDLVPEFSSIIALSETMAYLREQPFNDRNQLSLDMGVIHPLFKVATKCRSPHIRRRAIDLLGIVASLEAGWDASAYKAYAEMTMQLEEQRLVLDLSHRTYMEPSIICESRRIHVLEIWPTSERCSVVTFRTRPNGIGTRWVDVKETISW